MNFTYIEEISCTPSPFSLQDYNQQRTDAHRELLLSA